MLAPSGSQGWVPAHVVQVADQSSGLVYLPPKNVVPSANATVLGTSDAYYVRSAPDGYASEGNVNRESRVRVLAYEEDDEGYPWYEILAPSGHAGWIPEQIVQLDEGATLSLPEPPAFIPQD